MKRKEKQRKQESGVTSEMIADQISLEMTNAVLLSLSAVFGCGHSASPGQQEAGPESRGVHFCGPQPLH